jgi:acyl carrier protein
MDKKIFIEKFANEFPKTPSSEFHINVEYKNLTDWDSLTSLTVMAMIDEEYNIELNGDDIERAETINDLYELIKSKS